jgi:hypothetical protein
MRTPKTYQQVSPHTFRPEITHCPTCGKRLRRYATVSQRTIVTRTGPLCITHYGYRCPNLACSAPQRSYRSAAADALALPGFTFGLDIIVQIGHLRLAEEQSVERIHQTVGQELRAFQQTISRREILYLFDAYCTLLRTAYEPLHDPVWREQVTVNGGIILSIDGIQPDKGNETVYLVRDLVTGRLLAAENVLTSSTETLTRLLQPIADAEIPLLGVISDAQKTIKQAIATLWPNVPHQTCQFHYLREAGKQMYEYDRRIKVAMRKEINRKLRSFVQTVERNRATCAMDDDGPEPPDSDDVSSLPSPRADEVPPSERAHDTPTEPVPHEPVTSSPVPKTAEQTEAGTDGSPDDVSLAATLMLNLLVMIKTLAALVAHTTPSTKPFPSPTESPSAQEMGHPITPSQEAETPSSTESPGTTSPAIPAAPTVADAEAQQLAVLTMYAKGVQTVLHQDGLQPFVYGGLAMDAALNDIAGSLTHLEETAVTHRCAARLHRLQTIVGLREQWREQLQDVETMHARVVETERILRGAWANDPAEITNAAVGSRLDAWLETLKHECEAPTTTDAVQKGLRHFLKISTQLRSHLTVCYDVPQLPRTNNDTEGFIRQVKMRYRRMSGRKSWNQYLIRYGPRVVYYESLMTQAGASPATVAARLPGVDRAAWRHQRQQQKAREEHQRNRYRFRNKRERAFQHLENLWAEAGATVTHHHTRE